MERNRSGAASRCADAIRADGFLVDDRLHEESLEHVVVDDTSDPAWLSAEASGALVIRVRVAANRRNVGTVRMCLGLD